MKKLALALAATALFGQTAAPYGTWDSPITAKEVAAGGVGFKEIQIRKGTIYWVEGRPLEGGRSTLMSWNEEQGERDLLERKYNVRSRVHEYGGGALLVGKEQIYFVNDSDQQIYRLDGSPVTARKNARFADGCEHPDGSLYYVMEEHVQSVVNTIAHIRDGVVEVVASGHDFYANPRVSPDGSKLAYICWDFPNMPWDGTFLVVRDLATGEEKTVAGGTVESICDPQWSADGRLYYVSDRTNWWNLYVDGKPVWPVEGELAFPLWVFGDSWVALTSSGLFCTYAKQGMNEFNKVQLPYTAVKSLKCEGDQIAMIAASEQKPFSIVLYKEGEAKVIKQSRAAPDPAYVATATAIAYPTENDRTAYGFYYPPTNPKFVGMPGEKPPLIVYCHGGPTAHDPPSLNMRTLFWTSRGYAVVSVNYGGSSGYGREYRNRLNGQWGVVDVDDAVYAARYLVEQGLADPQRLAIEGGSAGGFTTLAALAFRDVFSMGADYFGVSDLEMLELDTHKFEAKYSDHLVGPYPERRDLYIARSPIHHVKNITKPVIIFQGAEDAIVPPQQSQVMYDSLKERGIRTEYYLFPGEQHGFRKAENIQRCLELQLEFFNTAFLGSASRSCSAGSSKSS